MYIHVHVYAQCIMHVRYLGVSKVEVDGLGVANVENTVGLRWKSCHYLHSMHSVVCMWHIGKPMQHVDQVSYTVTEFTGLHQVAMTF